MAIKPTDRRTGQTLDESTARTFVQAVHEGIREAARELSVNLDDFDIVVSDFAYHPIDSSAMIYQGAAKCAFRSAWEAWQRFPSVNGG